ncbi:hypothetical protein ABH973_006688 [Bradyrhizobium ottawaense]|uniref:hypothetical protein n=1 Tax=Bradyrhizobium ottawaense TaxID=931866 RepID=UPI003516D051
MIEALILAWKAASWGMRIAAVVGPLLIVGTAYGVWHHKVYQRGYARALADIAAEDRRAIGAATELRKTWAACRDRGGRWIQSEGRCS